MANYAGQRRNGMSETIPDSFWDELESIVNELTISMADELVEFKENEYTHVSPPLPPAAAVAVAQVPLPAVVHPPPAPIAQYVATIPKTLPQNSFGAAIFENYQNMHIGAAKQDNESDEDSRRRNKKKHKKDKKKHKRRSRSSSRETSFIERPVEKYGRASPAFSTRERSREKSVLRGRSPAMSIRGRSRSPKRSNSPAFYMRRSPTIRRSPVRRSRSRETYGAPPRGRSRSRERFGRSKSPRDHSGYGAPSYGRSKSRSRSTERSWGRGRGRQNSSEKSWDLPPEGFYGGRGGRGRGRGRGGFNNSFQRRKESKWDKPSTSGFNGSANNDDDDWDSLVSSTAAPLRPESRKISNAGDDDNWDDLVSSAPASTANLLSGDWNDLVPPSAKNKPATARKPARRGSDDGDNWDTLVGAGTAPRLLSPPRALSPPKRPGPIVKSNYKAMTPLSDDEDDWDAIGKAAKAKSPKRQGPVIKSNYTTPISDDEDDWDNMCGKGIKPPGVISPKRPRSRTSGGLLSPPRKRSASSPRRSPSPQKISQWPPPSKPPGPPPRVAKSKIADDDDEDWDSLVGTENCLGIPSKRPPIPVVPEEQRQQRRPGPRSQTRIPLDDEEDEDWEPLVGTHVKKTMFNKFGRNSLEKPASKSPSVDRSTVASMSEDETKVNPSSNEQPRNEAKEKGPKTCDEQMEIEQEAVEETVVEEMTVDESRHNPSEENNCEIQDEAGTEQPEKSITSATDVPNDDISHGEVNATLDKKVPEKLPTTATQEDEVLFAFDNGDASNDFELKVNESFEEGEIVDEDEVEPKTKNTKITSPVKVVRATPAKSDYTRKKQNNNNVAVSKPPLSEPENEPVKNTSLCPMLCQNEPQPEEPSLCPSEPPAETEIPIDEDRSLCPTPPPPGEKEPPEPEEIRSLPSSPPPGEKELPLEENRFLCPTPPPGEVNPNIVYEIPSSQSDDDVECIEEAA